MHKYHMPQVMECIFCRRQDCDGSAYGIYASHEPQMAPTIKWISEYYCDICGQKIIYDESEASIFGFRFPTISNMGIYEDGMPYTAPALGGRDFHFHNKCFKDHIKSRFLKRNRDQYGHEDFILPNNNEEDIISRLGVE